jgi:hypothetical protein
VGGREPVSAQRYDAAGGAASHEERPAGRGKRQRERGGGRSRRQKRRDDGGDRGAASLLYSSQAARRCHARSGGAKPEEATHRHLFYPSSKSDTSTSTICGTEYIAGDKTLPLFETHLYMGLLAQSIFEYALQGFPQAAGFGHS